MRVLLNRPAQNVVTTNYVPMVGRGPPMVKTLRWILKQLASRRRDRPAWANSVNPLPSTNPVALASTVRGAEEKEPPSKKFECHYCARFLL